METSDTIQNTSRIFSAIFLYSSMPASVINMLIMYQCLNGNTKNSAYDRAHNKYVILEQLASQPPESMTSEMFFPSPS